MMIHLFSMLGSFISSIAGRVVSSQIVRHLPAPIKQAPISNHEKELVQLRKELAHRKQDAELKKRELELQAKISADNLRLMQKHHVENVNLKLKEIQATYDVQHWAGILSREETIDILKQGQQENRFLILLSPPDVSPSCPLTFQHDLGKTLRGKVKEFVETYYPRNSAFPVQFFGKFFKSSIFDTEAVQLENLLSPVPTAVIFSDLTNKELLLHIHMWGMMGGKLSLSSSFEWKAEYKKLLAEGKDEEEALDEIQTAMVQTHKLLSGFLTDLYFLQANPLHKPQLFLIDKSIYPAELTNQLLEQLKQLQQSKLKEYEQLLLEKQQGKSIPNQTKQNSQNRLELLKTEAEQKRLEREKLFRLACEFLAYKDFKQAIPLLKEAAELDNADAQLIFAVMLGFGLGVEEDGMECNKWLHKSANNGNQVAIIGSKRTNAEEEQREIHKIAENGNLTAQIVLWISFKSRNYEDSNMYFKMFLASMGL